MKTLKLLNVFSLVVLGLLSCSQVVYAELAPEFTLTDIDGNTFSLSDFRGKIVLLDFFATWCGPCRSEMPHLKATQDEFYEELVVISISVDPDYDTVERLQQFRSSYNITWTLARDTANVAAKYDVSAIPTLYVIDQNGYVTFHKVGLTEELISMLETGKLLPKRSFNATVESLAFQVSVESNSSVTAFSFNKASVQIQFNVLGQSGAVGYCNVSIPKGFMKGEPWSITIDGAPIAEFHANENDTHSFLRFTFIHASTRRVAIQGTWIVPEFPSITMVLLFFGTIALMALQLNKLERKRKSLS